jgi:hypothetical protein
MLQPITTDRHGNTIKPRFTWSYSALNNWRTCPKKYFHNFVAKDFKEEQGEQLKWGQEVHNLLAERLKKDKPLPFTMRNCEPWITKLKSTTHRLYVEQKLAITEQFRPCEYFAKDVWFRMVADVLKIDHDIGLLLDWKTGRVNPDNDQLVMGAQAVFAHFPQLKAIRSVFVWLKDDMKTEATIWRNDLQAFWAKFMPELNRFREAHELTNFPPNPSGLCKRHCNVTSCPHNGRVE